MIGEPPLSNGADHDRLTCVCETAVAVKVVGGFGTLGADVDVGVAEASFEGLPVPTELIAETL